MIIFSAGSSLPPASRGVVFVIFSFLGFCVVVLGVGGVWNFVGKYSGAVLAFSGVVGGLLTVDFGGLGVFSSQELPDLNNFAGSSVPPAPGVQGLYNFCIWGDDFLQIWSLLAASTFLGVTGVVFSVDFVDFSGVLPNKFKFAGSSVPPAPGVQGL